MAESQTDYELSPVSKIRCVDSIADLEMFDNNAYFVILQDKNGKITYQELEPRDPEGSTISDYRAGAKEKIEKALETHDVVFLNGPSRSAKTEAVLLGGTNSGPERDLFLRSNTLNSDPNVRYIDDTILAGDVEDEYRYGLASELDIEELTYVADSIKTVIIDEARLEDHGEVIAELVPLGKKLVLSSGGLLSNRRKSEVFRTHLVAHLPPETKVAEINISNKPLSTTQLEEIGEAKKIYLNETQHSEFDTAWRQIITFGKAILSILT